MTRREQLQEKGINLNTLLIAISLAGAITTAVFFIAPLKTLPSDMEAVKQTQTVQTEALKTLAEVARDSRETRAEVIRHNEQIQDVRRRLDRLESQ